MMLGPEYTQKKLARELGVSEVAIKRIENGTLALSMEMKARIAGVTGVDPGSLDSGKFTISGRPFKRSSFFLFRLSTRTRKMGEDKAELHFGELRAQSRVIEELRTLTNAAANKNKFHVVLYLWDEWLYRTIKDFGLRDEFLISAKTQGIPAGTRQAWEQYFKAWEKTRARQKSRLGRRRKMRRKT
jgi:transcriptional regulator with XRE-family HTH domain